MSSTISAENRHTKCAKTPKDNAENTLQPGQSQSCWNLRVSAEADRGGRKYMEDVALVDFRREQNIEYAVFGIFDGHGGRQAARFAKAHLMSFIKQQKCFWSSRPENVKKAIHDGFIACHEAMRRKLKDWPTTLLGHPCTAGTTASIAIIRGNMLYVAYVGDSGIVMGYEKDPPNKDHEESNGNTSSRSNTNSNRIQDIQYNMNLPASLTFSKRLEGPAYPSSGLRGNTEQVYHYRELTTDHKPEGVVEKRRIEAAGGGVQIKNGVHRVIWNRPRAVNLPDGRRHFDENVVDKVPFLAVARSLGDLWSYVPSNNEFAVSPVPDIEVYNLNKKNETAKFIIIASDGIWNMIRPWDAVHLVSTFNKRKENGKTEGSPAHDLVREALSRWRMRGLRADNSTAVVVWLDRAPGVVTKQFVNRVWSSDNFMGNPNATHAHVVHGPNSSMADASVLKEGPTSLQRMNSLADDTDEKDQNNETNVSMNDSMGESSQNNVADKNLSSSNMHDMTHQCISEIKETIDDEYDDHDVAYDFDANIDDNEPAIYPSSARMKRFADLTIPAFQLGLISDDESDPEQTERDDHEMETDQQRTDLTATPIRIRHPSKENDEMGSNTTRQFETENCDENCEEEANAPSKSLVTSSKKRSHEKTVSNEKKEPQSGSANIEQNIHTGDPNIPNISIITQTRNTSTSVITTTTTTIVTRKRSSSDSNHSKSSKDSESSNAKKRKKSDPLGDVHEEDEHEVELESKIEDETNKDSKITSNDCDGTSSHKGSETSESSSSLSNKKSSRRSRRIGNKKKE